MLPGTRASRCALAILVSLTDRLKYSASEYVIRDMYPGSPASQTKTLQGAERGVERRFAETVFSSNARLFSESRPEALSLVDVKSFEVAEPRVSFELIEGLRDTHRVSPREAKTSGDISRIMHLLQGGAAKENSSN